ncbi:MAG TPA: penicillin-binding protein 2 [Candidatus Saccharimonadales bacterium]|nr:penicillin-binding protein 2 [Candidatus Saccharimonadales bacterium]
MFLSVISYLRRQPRANILALALLVVMSIFVVRLFYLQVVRHDYYLAIANANQMSKFTIPATRGEIYALSRGQPVPLVLNKTVYLMFADPSEVDDPEELKSAVRQVAGGDLIEGSLGSLDDDSLHYVVLARAINGDQAKLLKSKQIAGLGFKETTERVYPEGGLAAQTLGFVDANGQGQYGVEQSLNGQLAGRTGLLKTVTDVRNIPLTIGDNNIRQPAVDGQDIVLSIDRNIQAKVEAVLAKGLKHANAHHGSVVVMDPNTGKVMAMANLPTFDPANYAKTTDYADFSNDVVSSPYEPGSVMKTLSVGIGIASGAISKNSTYDNTNKIQVDGETINNSAVDPRIPDATVTDILHYSLNTGVVWTLKQMGGGEVNDKARQTLYNYYHDNFRLGRVTGIEQAGEQAGIIYKPNEGFGRNVRYANMTFGQAMSVTMIQFAAAFSAEINGGTYYQPSVVAGWLEDDGTLKPKPAKSLGQSISRKDSLTMRRLIHKATMAGTFGSVAPDGYNIGGKTGTAQKIDPETGKYSMEYNQTTGSYVGFGGTDTPRYVIMVRVMDPNIPGYAGTEAAAPIFNDISNWMINYLRLPPNK